MAEQVFVTVDDIVKRQKGGTLTLKVQIFAEGADPVGDPEVEPPVLPDEPLFETTTSADIKAKANDQTVQQLVNRATTEAGTELLEAVKTWVRIEAYTPMVHTTAVENAIIAELAG